MLQVEEELNADEPTSTHTAPSRFDSLIEQIRREQHLVLLEISARDGRASVLVSSG